MRRLVALIVSMAFAFGVGLAVPQAFAQTPAPKDEKKGEMTEKKGEKKAGEKKAGEKKAAKKKADKKPETKADKKDKKDDKK